MDLCGTPALTDDRLVVGLFKTTLWNLFLRKLAVNLRGISTLPTQSCCIQGPCIIPGQRL